MFEVFKSSLTSPSTHELEMLCGDPPITREVLIAKQSLKSES